MNSWLTGRRAYLLLALVVLAWRLATALPVERAGYMDASYTLQVARNLVEGRGLNDEILWNYLDEPASLPHPSNLYWLPLPAWLTAASYSAFGTSYRAAQIPFILLSLFPPLFAFYLARRASGRAVHGWVAGLLAAFSGFYTIYWVAPDNFVTFTVTADLALFAIAQAGEGESGSRSNVLWLLAGIAAGLSQLSRVDAFLLLAVVPLWEVLAHKSPRLALRSTVLAGAGFLLVFAPWLVRNYVVSGSPFAAGGTRTLWLISYEEIFRFGVQELTLQRYLDWGFGNIVLSKLRALGFDLLVLIGGLQVFLAPLAALGLWRWRSRVEFQPVLIYLLLLLLAMAFVFTLPGMRGSMLHSSAALIPFLSAAAPAGLDSAIAWIARRRKQWTEASAQTFFRMGFVALAFFLSLYIYSQGIFAFGPSGIRDTPLWNERDREYTAVGEELGRRGVPREQPIITVDPPSFYNETGRRSIVVPTDSIDALFLAARQFDAHYLVLQYDHPLTLDAVYYGGVAIDGLVPVKGWSDAAGKPVMLLEIRR